jgi:hypothetical protein
VTVAYPLRRLRIVFSLFSSIVRDVFFQFSVHILLNNSLVDVQHELFTNRSMQSVKNIVVVLDCIIMLSLRMFDLLQFMETALYCWLAI